MKNKIIKTILTILMAISILPVMATTVHADGWDGKGTKGDPWQIGSPDAAAVKAWLTQDYDDNITLHISGLGEMQDFKDKTPWEDYTHDITRLDIRKDITNIGANAFNSFNKLTSVSVPLGVTHIGEGAFGFCGSLTNISLPSSLTSISDKVFWYCLALEQITIPSNVTEIGNSLFYQCTRLKTVTFKPGSDNNTLTFDEGTFTDIDKDKKLAYTSEIAKLYEGETVFDAGSDLYQFNGKTLTWRTSEYPLWVGGVQVKRANKNDILNGTKNTGTAIFTPAGAGENPSPATLTLKEAVISEGHYISDEESYGIYYYGKDELNIILESKNIVGVDPYYGFTYGIYSSEAPKVTFSGSGSLDVTAGDGGIDTGIFVNGDLEINETKVTSSVSGYFSNAIYAKNLLINKSTVTSTASEEYSRGIYASNSVTINGSTVTSTASGKNTNGIYAKNSEIESGVVTAGGENAAIYGKVENAISGKGWADVEHTDEPTPIDISTQGRELEFKYVEFKDHTHSFTYSSDGATITATCVNTDGKCDLPDGKATLTIAAPLHTTYGDEKDASAVIIDEYGIQGDATVSYYKANTDDTRGEALSEAPTDAGKYWAEITLGEGENSATAHVVYTIAKAQLTDVSVKQNGTLTYNGEAQTPQVNAIATAKGGQTVTFTYSKTQDGEYTSTVPSITNVNESGTFYYKASAPNHEDASGSFEVTMEKAASSAATAKANHRTYDASEKPLVTVTGSATGGTMNYAIGEDSITAPTNWNDAIPSAKNADIYYVWYKVAGDENHKDTQAVCVPVTISKANLTVEALNQNIKVGGHVPDLTNPVLDTHYSVKGLVGKDKLTTAPNMSYRKEGSAANPDSSKANTFEIKISGGSAGENYSITYKDAILTISDKKTQTITAKDVTVTYGDTDKSVSATVKEPASGGGKITFAVKDDSRSYIKIDSDTGVLSIRSVPSDNKAYVLVTAAETEEYAKASIEVLITINKANSSVSKAPEAISNLRYTGTAQELVNKGQAKGGTMNYALGDNSETEPTEWSNTIPSASDAKTYYVWYMVKGNNNYNNSAVFGPIEISIGKADTKGEVTEENYPTSNEPLTYNASAQKLLNDPKEYPQDYDTILYSTDGGTSWSDKAEATDAGIHQIRFKFTSPNYEDLKGPIMGVEIKKATGSVTSQDQKPAPLEDLKYSESAKELLEAPKELPEGYDKVQYSMDDGKSWSDSIPKGQGGDYTVKVKYIGDKNHNDFIGDYELTVTVQNSYTANDTSWVKGSSDGDLIIYKAKVQDEQTYGKFIGVKVDNDNEFLDPSKYDKSKGSVRITLKPSYLETLSIGRHTLNAYFSDGAIVPAYFTIRERIKPTTPDYVIPMTGVEQ